MEYSVGIHELAGSERSQGVFRLVGPFSPNPTHSYVQKTVERSV
jgi:hypothetical protein